TVVTLVTPHQRRDMSRLMATAGITPRIAQVRSGEAELTRITGAQAPSGVPVTITAPVADRARPSTSAASARGRRSRPAQARRSARAALAPTETPQRRSPLSPAA
ncbi:ATP-dependent helicase, partial [Streptomyces sp. NPDC051976]